MCIVNTMQLLVYALLIVALLIHQINGFNETSAFNETNGFNETIDEVGSDIVGMDYLALPEAQHNISSILCIIKFCEKYFRSEKAVIGSLVIVNVQNTTEFHSELIIMLNEHANYDLGVMTKDATKPHASPVHVTDKAKNYFVVFNRTSEVGDAINQW